MSPYMIVRNENPQFPLYLVKDEVGGGSPYLSDLVLGWSPRKADAYLCPSYEAETIATELSRHASIVAVDIVGVRNTEEYRHEAI